MKTFSLLLLFVCSFSSVFAQYDNVQPVEIGVDFDAKLGELKPIWAFWGYDEPNYTYMKDGKKLLTEISELSKVPVYVRAHSLLVTGDGEAALKWGSTNAYTEDENGNPIYDWTIIDKIFDTYIERGMKPLAQIGFMPEALSTKPQPYRHHWKPGAEYGDIYTGWAYPPNDYSKWAELVYQWVLHSVARYGKEEVESWYWELWNEPNIGYWRGTTEEYIKLYDYTADAVKRALPTAKMGGPETTGPGWDKAEAFLRTFLDHIISGKNYATGETGAPLDFITYHAKGSPKLVDGHIQMNMGSQLNDLAKGFEVVASYPTLKDLPIIIGESDPEGCAACSEEDYPENAYRNGTMYSSYTAASFARKYDLARAYGVNLKGAVTWGFEFEDQAWYAGFRDMATNGVDKPVLNVFRMFGMMHDTQVAVTGDLEYDYKKVRSKSVRENPDVNSLASVGEDGASVMVFNYHDRDDLEVAASPVTINLKNIPAQKVLVNQYRVDQEFSNSYSLYKEMGSPENPTPEQIKALEQAGQLQLFTSPVWMPVTDGNLELSLDLPRQGVALFQLEFEK
ncbi:xylan 1,4-beta-xylosidase [Leeuwenhoekiella aestuarii]|uniref:Xylan 1,4-beta-xylosidase n=1 Tax=Leeuwenhoekiella aestuarii TaxID=2249426 RepID=A0A4V1KPY3_9FLAO|nr:beta-xylosidase [Leeuwenhoekiella aestuarii]RXG18292.1 xylan 1,4-beta-xylosidase [Leeuwenhoekiella aestuarii]RXG19597.1 xylan 1,4-beta-xylosidase [Leeuwenhoekiella aestuarii]